MYYIHSVLYFPVVPERVLHMCYNKPDEVLPKLVHYGKILHAYVFSRQYSTLLRLMLYYPLDHCALVQYFL